MVVLEITMVEVVVWSNNNCSGSRSKEKQKQTDNVKLQKNTV